MDWFLLRPASIPALTQLVLVGIILLSLLRIKDNSSSTRFLIAFFGANFLLFVSIFISISVSAYWAYYFTINQHTILFFSLTVLIQFAYAFLGNPFREESRIVFVITGILSVGLLIYVAFQLISFGPFHNMPLLVIGFLFPVMICWVLVVHIRKAVYYHGVDAQKTKAHTRFACLNGLIVLVALAASLRDAGLIPLEALLYILEIGVLTYLAGFVAVYVSYTSAPTSLQIRLIGISLVTVLAILGLAGIGIYSTNQLLEESTIRNPDKESLRFTRNTSEGYLIERIPFGFDAQTGENLNLGDEESRRVELGFSFPFYGQEWTEAYINSNGLIAFGEPIRLPDHVIHRIGSVYYKEFYTAPPKIAPLFMDLDPSIQGGVFIKRVQGTATITWFEIPQWSTTKNNTFQLVLKDDGSFEFSYDSIEAPLVYGSATGSIRGIHPGIEGEHSETPLLSTASTFTSAPLTPVYEDYRILYRRFAHSKVVRLAYFILFSTLFILVAFPLFLHASIAKPIYKLLSGVHRVNDGDLDVRVPVDSYDEIGRLTQNFNRMTESIRAAENKLKAHAEDLEHRVEKRTLELEKANKELQKMDQVKSRFFANISHEFRTPLTLINAPLERLLSDSESKELSVTRAQLYGMLQGGHHLLRLTNQILDLAKIDAGKMRLNAQQGNIVEFVRSIVMSFTSYAESKGVDLQFREGQEEIKLYYDPDFIEKALYNLLSNAIKFAPDGVVRVKVVERNPNDGAIDIIVKDSGIGIPHDKLDHIFDRFYQTEDSMQLAHGGTGIGLHLTKELIELHKGSITVDSEVGIGSTFVLSLLKGHSHFKPNELVMDQRNEFIDRPPSPSLLLSTPSLQENQINRVGESSPHEEQYSLLIADDSPAILRLLKECLEPLYRVREAKDGQEALTIARESVPDLIIADVMMPVMDGLTFSRNVKEDKVLNHIPIILLTAGASEERKLEGLGTGANIYLTKPFNEKELLTSVKNLLHLRESLQHHLKKELLLYPNDVEVMSADEQFLRRLQDIMEENMEDVAFNVDALAELLFMSPRQLQRKVKALVGETPNAVIRMSRLDRAAQLLNKNAGTISEIAYRVGFNDAAYFTRCFKERFGKSPTSFIGEA